MAPADPILGVAIAYKNDPLPPSQKVYNFGRCHTEHLDMVDTE